MLGERHGDENDRPFKLLATQRARQTCYGRNKRQFKPRPIRAEHSSRRNAAARAVLKIDPSVD